MKDLFDYIGFRILKWNRITQNAKNDSGGIAYYTLFQGIFILDIVAIIITENYTSGEKYGMRNILKTITVIVGVLIYLFNIFYFKNKYSEFNNRWGSEDLSKRKRRGWIMALSFIFIFLFWIIYLNLRRNVLG